MFSSVVLLKGCGKSKEGRKQTQKFAKGGLWDSQRLVCLACQKEDRSDLTAMYKYLHGEKMLAIKGLSNLEGGKKGVGVTDWKLKLDKFILEMKHEFQEGRWLSREQSQT